MNKKSTKTFSIHYNVWFQRVKGLVNGFEFFWKWHFCKFFNIKFYFKMKFLLKKLKDFFEDLKNNIPKFF
jgi:hypothetical protein